MPKVIAVTGNIGSGKTTAAKILERRGALRIDADRLARDVVEPGQPALAEIVAAFGPEMLLADGTLDRAAVGRHVFSNLEAKKRLEMITHPRIRDAMFRAIAAAMAKQPPLIVLEIPLLFEGGMHKQFPDSLLIVAADGTRLARVRARDGCSDEDARARMAAQLPQAEKIPLARWVVANDGDENALAQALTALWPQLVA